MWWLSAPASEEYRRRAVQGRVPGHAARPVPVQHVSAAALSGGDRGLNPGDVTYALRFFAARHEGVRFRCAESLPSTMISKKWSVTTDTGSALII